MLTVSKIGNWKIYWGIGPLPEGSEVFGTVQRETLETGALIRLASGVYMQGNAGVIRTLPQREVQDAVAVSIAAGALGSLTSEKKARASAINGRKGGRPPKTQEDKHNV